MIKAGIIGATGYAGNELARLLLGHKETEVVCMDPEAILIRNTQESIRTFLNWWMQNVWMIIWKLWQMKWM